MKRLILSWLAVTLGIILLLRFIDPPLWSWKLQRELDPPPGYPAIPQHYWLSLEQIPPAMLLALVAAEDQRFPHHYGLDFRAILESIEDARNHKGLRGASTLTQQTAKNLFLWEGRDWSRKLLEAGLAILLELIWDKARILEVYLNIVEFGPGVYGIGAGSAYWYRQPADQLSPNQAARLAAILPNPWEYRAEPPSPHVEERARWIEQQMEQLGYVWLIPVTGW
ncbi:MAG: monofunctional biosynthetic peptidoglycan transglycosylase [Gammaproteobacteria bacterium]|nr:monofunctional biosynthetic peptidoglycan transglycosylase [Gammaproteobacteria bacterium]